MFFDFLFFSSGNMSIYHCNNDDLVSEDSLTSDKRLVRIRRPERTSVGSVGCTNLYNQSGRYCFSYSSNHEYGHVCYDAFFPKYLLYEIEILDYDRRNRI